MESWIFSMHYSSLKQNFVLLSMLKTVVLLDIFVKLHCTTQVFTVIFDQLNY